MDNGGACLNKRGRCEKQSIITSAASWWGCIVRPFLAVSYIQGCFRKSLEGGGARRDAINLLSASSSVSSCFFSPSWMQMRQRGGNIECDQTLKRTRHLNVWQITTTRLFISPLTSMMDVSTHTHTHMHTSKRKHSNHGYSRHCLATELVANLLTYLLFFCDSALQELVLLCCLSTTSFQHYEIQNL